MSLMITNLMITVKESNTVDIDFLYYILSYSLLNSCIKQTLLQDICTKILECTVHLSIKTIYSKTSIV